MDSNQGTQRERIYSPPQLPLCHIPIPFSAAREALSPSQAGNNLRRCNPVVNVYLPPGRIHAHEVNTSAGRNGCLSRSSQSRPRPRRTRPRKKFLEPVEGVEPPTHGLQNRCSAIEPYRRVSMIADLPFARQMPAAGRSPIMRRLPERAAHNLDCEAAAFPVRRDGRNRSLFADCVAHL